MTEFYITFHVNGNAIHDKKTGKEVLDMFNTLRELKKHDIYTFLAVRARKYGGAWTMYLPRDNGTIDKFYCGSTAKPARFIQTF